MVSPWLRKTSTGVIRGLNDLKASTPTTRSSEGGYKIATNSLHIYIYIYICIYIYIYGSLSVSRSLLQTGSESEAAAPLPLHADAQGAKAAGQEDEPGGNGRPPRQTGRLRLASAFIRGLRTWRRKHSSFVWLSVLSITFWSEAWPPCTPSYLTWRSSSLILMLMQGDFADFAALVSHDPFSMGCCLVYRLTRQSNSEFLFDCCSSCGTCGKLREFRFQFSCAVDGQNLLFWNPQRSRFPLFFLIGHPGFEEWSTRGWIPHQSIHKSSPCIFRGHWLLVVHGLEGQIDPKYILSIVWAVWMKFLKLLLEVFLTGHPGCEE